MPDFLAEVLTWPNHYAYALAIETAMSLNLPPRVMLEEGRQPSQGWSEEDKKLAIAWTIMNKETCRSCGKPLWICRADSRDLVFSVQTDICYSTAALEDWRKTSKAKRLKNGENPFVTARMRNASDPMPSRKAYIEKMME